MKTDNDRLQQELERQKAKKKALKGANKKIAEEMEAQKERGKDKEERVVKKKREETPLKVNKVSVYFGHCLTAEQRRREDSVEEMDQVDDVEEEEEIRAPAPKRQKVASGRAATPKKKAEPSNQKGLAGNGVDPNTLTIPKLRGEVRVLFLPLC